MGAVARPGVHDAGTEYDLGDTKVSPGKERRGPAQGPNGRDAAARTLSRARTAETRRGPCPGPERQRRGQTGRFLTSGEGEGGDVGPPTGRLAVVPMREMAYPPQLLLRALSGPDEGLDE